EYERSALVAARRARRVEPDVDRAARRATGNDGDELTRVDDGVSGQVDAGGRRPARPFRRGRRAGNAPRGGAHQRRAAQPPAAGGAPPGTARIDRRGEAWAAIVPRTSVVPASSAASTRR